MLINILIGLAVILAILLIVIALQPNTFHIERSTTIAAPPGIVFGHINDLHKWQEVNPWAKMDPGMKVTYTGPQAGEGAAYTWAGEKSGEGAMTLLESRPSELVKFKLNFIKPFAATNTVDFTFTPQGDGTKVVWAMYGANQFMGKAMGLFGGMEKMCGPDFEKGLASLKELSEAAAR